MTTGSDFVIELVTLYSRENTCRFLRILVNKTEVFPILINRSEDIRPHTSQTHGGRGVPARTTADKAKGYRSVKAMKLPPGDVITT